jgi:hypothetical protein
LIISQIALLFLVDVQVLSPLLLLSPRALGA